MSDETVNYQSGRVAGIFSAGTKVEALQESYSSEIETFVAMKAAFAMAANALVDYKSQMLKEMSEARLPIKDVEVGKTYVNRCVDIVQKLFVDTEAKRLQAIGAADALSKAVISMKRAFDEENVKLKTFEEFSVTPQEPKERPVGYPPKKKKVKKDAENA